MPDFRMWPAPVAFQFPSGDVTQTINPWNWIGLNINLGQSSNPETERAVLDEVGSYGRQIGRIGEALAVLVKKARKPSYQFGLEDNEALDELLHQVKAVAKIKERERP